MYYLHFNISIHSSCYLLESFGDQVKTCKDGTCITGTPNCREDLCGYVVDNQVKYGMLVTDTSAPSVIGLLTIGSSCPPPIIIAIGPGGTSSALAGGSGYVEYKILDTTTETFTELTAEVGANIGAPEHRFVLGCLVFIYPCSIICSMF